MPTIIIFTRASPSSSKSALAYMPRSIGLSAERLQAYSDKETKIMRFSGVPLANALGLQLVQPYLDPELIAISQQCTRDEEINYHHHPYHGKFILREAFEEKAFSAWRKEPIEVGSGTTVLPKMFQEPISAEDLKKEQDRIFEQEGIKIQDVEHYQYYKVFKKVFGDGMGTYPEKLRKDG
ncbi:hypothetical protein BGZ67_000536 [Mortierella alpina]|nr:hypothetical protein BGZ67_000536 [Mortierella alpina]